ncbi:NUDIX hydrolase [Bradyrhizobium sp. 141]|uniref:NUDIX hydrolase n=1 Tax=Bradyrhizobium sp. 141 TaxID=2782617 RepID=UPI001FFB3122|nr:NUDIX hydrolase [Bradyrhizobium sp. 141]MCK1717527.1 NUDIX hydrolase [Bradyrhizobium sp. 141]
MRSNEIDSDFEFFAVRSFDWLSRNSAASERYHVLSCPDWVNVIAFTQKQELISVKQFRHGASVRNHELPGGMISSGCTPLEAAQGELFEETGYASKHWYQAGRYRPNAALQNNWCYSFVCFEATQETSRRPDELELCLIEAQCFPTFLEDELMSQALMVTSLLLAKRNLSKVASPDHLDVAKEFLRAL